MARGKRRARPRPPRGDGEPERPERLKAPTSDYRDAEGNVLTLRGSFTPKARLEYAQTLAGHGQVREDAYQRAVELLFERLAARWVIAGVALERQRELLARLRAASPQERAWVRGVLREHCAENFPDVTAP